MRCNNCGWQNPGGKLRCEKCNYSLSISPGAQEGGDQTPKDPNNLSQTIKGSASEMDPWDTPTQGPQGTPNQQWPASPPPVAPPSYGAGGFKGTIDPSRQPATDASGGFTMNPVNKDGEPAKAPLQFTGAEVVLNRDNVDPGNPSITSKEQACIMQIDGAWHIVDRSALETTFVRVGTPHKLSKGDVILLGNRKFIFDPEA